DDLVDTLKHFSLFTERLGCIHSSIFKSIHGNMIVWYGAWIKRSHDDKELLREALHILLDDRYGGGRASLMDGLEKSTQCSHL
nr:UDP-4-amino-4,6-dideoxy-N-acetyl-beta-L-altrosamine transaminase [Tanacetum cinerariifolium]